MRQWLQVAEVVFYRRQFVRSQCAWIDADQRRSVQHLFKFHEQGDRIACRVQHNNPDVNELFRGEIIANCFGVIFEAHAASPVEGIQSSVWAVRVSHWQCCKITHDGDDC